MRLSEPTPRQIAREADAARASDVAARAWRRHVRRLAIACFASLAVAIAIGVTGFMVSDENLGWVLIQAGETATLLFPFVILVLWVVEADRNGDL